MRSRRTILAAALAVPSIFAAAFIVGRVADPPVLNIPDPVVVTVQPGPSYTAPAVRWGIRLPLSVNYPLSERTP